MELKTRSINLMGAAIDVVIYMDDEKKAESVLDEAVELLHKYNKVFSANDSSSELMKINDNAGKRSVNVRDELYDLIKIAKNSSLDDGFFNAVLGPIIQEWRIGFKDAKVAEENRIKELLALTDPVDIILDDDEKSVFLRKEGMQINLGAIAKGYIADLIVKFLKGSGVKSGFINLGGNFLTFGDALHNENKYWKVGIQNPKLSRGNHVCIVKVKDESVVTSGVYERVLNSNGKKYHHILNPKTGYPVETSITALTIISKNSVTCEIWTTQLFGKKIEDIMDEIEENPQIEGIIITNKEEIYYTSGLEGKII